MAAQLRQLADAAKTPHLTIQVIPFTADAHAGSDGAISLLSFYDGPDLAYTEGPGHGQLITDPEEVADCTLCFDHLLAAALPLEPSLRYLTAALEG